MGQTVAKFRNIALNRASRFVIHSQTEAGLAYLLWGVLFWDQPVELRGSRQLHALKLPEQTHGYGLSRVGLEDGGGAAWKHGTKQNISTVFVDTTKQKSVVSLDFVEFLGTFFYYV